MSDSLDLDALVPKTGTIKFEGKVIEVHPPTTEDLFEINVLANKLKDFKSEDPNEVVNALKEIRDTLSKLIPELTDKKLSLDQLLGVINFIVDMATPPDVKELKDKGVEPVVNEDPKEPRVS